MGGALRHALRWGVAATLVAAALAVLSPPPAGAVSSGRPIAIAVGTDGTSYVGFASGGKLLRLDADGNPDGSLALSSSGPVDGLAVDADGNVWVDDGETVSQVAPDGTPLTQFAHDPGGNCPVDHAHDPARYGGLAVTSDRVYVAARCRADVEVYDLAGNLEAQVGLPGNDYPRGVALAPAFDGVPARLYVGVPDSRVVQVYNLRSLRTGADPVRTVHVQRGPGFAGPLISGLIADTKGQLGVLDAANNAIYFYNATQDYGFYRTLGHPPDPGSGKGHLDHARSITLGAPVLGGNYWIADTGNGRVQRWTVEGTTRWMADAQTPGDPGAPVNTAVPVITGTADVGFELTCSDGEWTGAPFAFTRVWQRDGVTIDGATDSTYVVSDADAGTEISCVVTALNDVGASGPASSEPVTIPGGTEPPVKTCRGRPAVKIDKGAHYARDPYTVLTIRAPVGATAVTISNDAKFKRADTKALVTSCRYLWTLDKRSSKVPKTVWVRFPGAASAGRAKDQIVLDSAAPKLKRVTAAWSNARWGWVVHIHASDQGTGLATVTYGSSRRSNKTVRWGTDIVSWDSGWIRWFQVKDRAGNVSRWYHLTGI
ncbi:hypothetical protein [Nocardioides sp.]|uniref:hypothetical protein n=1 Tax=Nocardioides sp. TaxID=35761 RepID=UPI0037837519